MAVGLTEFSWAFYAWADDQNHVVNTRCINGSYGWFVYIGLAKFDINYEHKGRSNMV